jgi:Flp pilus assembly protein TadG
MRGLSRDEDGAVAVTVAVILVVLVAVSSIVVDAGGLYFERRQLQNGADAAALAIAYDCAGGDCRTPGVTANEFALANNSDGSNVESIAPVAVTPASNEVTVSVRSGEADGSPGVVRNIFHTATTTLLGAASGSEDSVVRARATASWGGAGLQQEYDSLPLTVSLCDFMGSPGPHSVAALDAKAAALPSVEDLPRNGAGQVTGGVTVSLHDPKKDAADACTVAPGFSAEAETKMPGGFGWLDVNKGTCGVNILGTEEDGQFWVGSKNGMQPAGRTCLAGQYQRAPSVPVFTAFRTSPQNAYRLYAPAAFFITGVDVPGLKLGESAACGGWCIRGHFVKKVDPGLPIGGGPSLGVNAVELTN